MNILKRLIGWWYRPLLETQIARLQIDRDIAVQALKNIACGQCIHPVATADKALRRMGYMAVTEDANCPSDRIYFVPSGWAKPTDYI